jgi:geranylgeranyl diphosphate synthase, type I
MNFLEYLQSSNQKTTERLNIICETHVKTHLQKSATIKHLVPLYTDTLFGGKMLRSTLVCLGFDLFAKGRHHEDLYQIAAALEMIHSSFLIHDDIIDQSALRRGKPTLHTVFPDLHYGRSQAICLGDFGFFQAYALILGTSFPPILIQQVLHMVAQTCLQTIVGEMVDVELPYQKRWRHDDVIFVHSLKTAYYTIVSPLNVGAILGGASSPQLKSIEEYGLACGIAFQIHDDILGVYASEDKSGKSNHSDIKEGKSTLLIAYALEHSNADDKAYLQKWYGNSEATSDHCSQIREIFKSSGAYDHSVQLAHQYIDEGKSHISKITKDKTYQTLLTELADLLISRER